MSVFLPEAVVFVREDGRRTTFCEDTKVLHESMGEDRILTVTVRHMREVLNP